MSDVRIIHADMRDALAEMAENSVDSGVTDPPYHLTSIVKRFGSEGAAPAKVGKTGAYARASVGFMGKQWDGGDIAFQPETWAAVLRVLKPGAHLLAFGGTRTFHRMACAIEDAGFEIRDTIMWLYGSGFPKSHDVSKGIDRAADYRIQSAVRRAAVEAVEAAGLRLPGNSRHDWTAGEHAPGDKWWSEFRAWVPGLSDDDRERIEGKIVARVQKVAGWFTQGDIYDVRSAATPEAEQWQGWGTALKPAVEPIILARKPLIGTVAANVLQHGTGALNIDGCRIHGAKPATTRGAGGQHGRFSQIGAQGRIEDDGKGRWPANVIHDGSDEVVAAFPDAPGQMAAVKGTEKSSPFANVYGDMPNRAGRADPRGDSGSAARFFYQAKATKADRLGSKHPTVKPVDLIRYLVRLVTPPGGTVLDCFAGSGTTGMAAIAEGFNAILIEREAEYIADIKRRIDHVRGSDFDLFAPLREETAGLFDGDAA